MSAVSRQQRIETHAHMMITSKKEKASLHEKYIITIYYTQDDPVTWPNKSSTNTDQIQPTTHKFPNSLNPFSQHFVKIDSNFSTRSLINI